MAVINWWNSKTIQNSQLLWKPTLEPVCTSQITSKSWFESNTQRFPCPRPLILPQNTPSTSKEVIRCRKIKLNPSKEQKKQLVRWWHHYRFTYNRTIEALIEDVLDHEENVFRLKVCLDVDEKGKVHVQFGTELQPNSRLKLKLQTRPEFKKLDCSLKVSTSKKTPGKVLFRIKVIEEPRPVRVAFGYEYPPPRSWKEYRDELVTAKAVRSKHWFSQQPDLLETNKHLRTGAVQQAVSAYKTVCSNAKNNGTKGSLRTLFLKKKHESWSMHLDRECVKTVQIKHEKKSAGKKQTSLWKEKCKGQEKWIDAVSLCPSVMKEPIPAWEKIGALQCDPKIHRDRWGDYWLIAPFKVMTKTRPQGSKPSCAFDIGEKTFMTGYTTEGTIFNLGVDTRSRLLSVLKRIDTLQSKLDQNQYRGRIRAWAKDQIEKLWKKMAHLKDELHWKVAKEILSNHNLVVIGKLNIQSILKSDSIPKSVKRVLQQQGHYQFKQRLIGKAEELGVHLKYWSEWGTTKGCPCCGRRNEVQGRVFQCSQCSYTADRDAKAACCILLKYMSETW